jgi:hypothetical protein
LIFQRDDFEPSGKGGVARTCCGHGCLGVWGGIKRKSGHEGYLHAMHAENMQVRKNSAGLVDVNDIREDDLVNRQKNHEAPGAGG